jgi:hypothetical protein
MYYVVIEYTPSGPTHLVGIFTNFDKANNAMIEHNELALEEGFDDHRVTIRSVRNLNTPCTDIES